MNQILDATPSPLGKIYKDRAIWAATFLGGPLVGGYMIAENFKALGEPDKVNKTWICTILLSVIIIGSVFMIPNSVRIPNQSIPIVYTVIAYYLVQHFQGKSIEKHIQAGGEFYSWGRVIGVALIGFLIILFLLMLVILLHLPL